MKALVRVAAAVLAVPMALAAPVPAMAAGPTVDVSGLGLPPGVAIVGAPTLQYNGDTFFTEACLRFSYAGGPASLFLHDLRVNGMTQLIEGILNLRQVLPVPNDQPGAAADCVPVAAGDQTQSTDTYVLTSTSANSAVAQAQPLTADVLAPLIARFAGLPHPIRVVEPSMDPIAEPFLDVDGRLRYRFRVNVPTTYGRDQRITVANPRIRTGDGRVIALTAPPPAQLLWGFFADDGQDITVGVTDVDPQMGLGAITVDADVSQIPPSVVKVPGPLPRGLTVKVAPEDWTYEPGNNRTVMSSVELWNSTSAPISVAVTPVSVIDSATSKPVKGSLKATAATMVTVLPGWVSWVTPFTGAISGDARSGMKLTLRMKVTPVPVSTLRISGLKIPKGVSLMPFGLQNLQYDRRHKHTAVSVSFKYPSNPARDLSLESLTLNGSRIRNTVIPGGLDDLSDWKFRIFTVSLGTLSGDARLGRTLTVRGTLRLVTPKTHR